MGFIRSQPNRSPSPTAHLRAGHGSRSWGLPHAGGDEEGGRTGSALPPLPLLYSQVLCFIITYTISVSQVLLGGYKFG